MSAQHLRDLENRRRHATLIAVLLDTAATITNQILDMHDRIVGRMFNEAKRKHEQSFAESRRARTRPNPSLPTMVGEGRTSAQSVTNE